jgi:heptaprenyl diphosphate synthase
LFLRDRLDPREYEAWFERESDDMTELVDLVRTSGAVEDSYAEARRLTDEAQESLEVLPPGPARDTLHEIASYTVERPR